MQLPDLQVHEAVGYTVIAIGVMFNLFGCIGLVRLPNLYNRMQASTKCVTLGIISVLLGTAMVLGFSAISAKALLCAAFILLTSPTATHALARASYLFGIKLWDKAACDHYGEDRKYQGDRS